MKKDIVPNNQQQLHFSEFVQSIGLAQKQSNGEVQSISLAQKQCNIDAPVLFQQIREKVHKRASYKLFITVQSISLVQKEDNKYGASAQSNAWCGKKRRIAECSIHFVRDQSNQKSSHVVRTLDCF